MKEICSTAMQCNAHAHENAHVKSICSMKEICSTPSEAERVGENFRYTSVKQVLSSSPNQTCRTPHSAWK